MSFSRPDNREIDYSYQNIGFDAEVAHSRKSRPGCCFFACCSGCLTLLLLLVLGIFALWYSLFSGGVPLEVSPETTIIVGPLKSDGKTIDFHEAIKTMVQPDARADENGFIDVLIGYGQAVFGFDHPRNDGMQQYLLLCDTFGIDPQAPPVWSLPPLQGNDHQWLAEANEGLDAVQVAAAKPHYFIPWERINEHDLVVTSQPFAAYAFHEKLSDALRFRADVRFRLGENAEAWKDVLTSIRLFRYVTINQAWLAALEGKDDESFLTSVLQVAATLPNWTPEQLEQAIKDLESLPAGQDRKTMLTMMQFMLLDMISATNDWDGLQNRLHGRAPREMRETLDMLRVIAFDWNLVAKGLNQEFKTYGELLESVADKGLEEQFEILRLRLPGERRRKPLDEEQLSQMLVRHFEAEGSLDFLFTPGRSKLMGSVAGQQLVSWATGEMYRLQIMEESRCQTLRLVLALERYHREHQQYPDSLQVLGLEPVRPNMHLHYERRGTGYRIKNMVFEFAR